MGKNIILPVVRLIVTDYWDRVLMLQRQNSNRGNGGWCPPGGMVEYGETVDTAIERELKEETNLDLVRSRLLFHRDYIEPEIGHWLILFFKCDAAGTIAIDKDPDKGSSDYIWLAKGDLDKYDVVFRNELALKRYWESNSSRI